MANPKYSIVGELGKGGFGVVYLIKSDNGPKLALKTVDLRKIPLDFKARASDEAKILETLNHQFLVHHVNSFLKGSLLCIITEFCEAGDLDKFIETLQFVDGLPEKLITCWLMQAASALNYMHTHDPVILHRDLKPQNIYVTETGDLRLGDLGLARKLAGPQDMANTVAGTIVYLSPEILSRQPYNSKSDIWSLGCVFYDITGKKGADEMGVMFLIMQVMGGRKVPLPDHYSEKLKQVITSMLTKDPRTRPSAANVLASPAVRAFEQNPEKPADIIAAHARSKRRTPPKLARDLSTLIPPYSLPLTSSDIVVPRHKLEAMERAVAEGASVRPVPKPRAVPQTVRDTGLDPTQAVAGMSQNSMFLFGGAGGVDAAAGATGGSDPTNETFFDSNQNAEFNEEHFLLKITQLQSECHKGLGADILQAAYAVIDNVHDIDTLKIELEELMGTAMYNTYGAMILQLQVLEYGLIKKMKSIRNAGSRQPRPQRTKQPKSSCDLS